MRLLLSVVVALGCAACSDSPGGVPVRAGQAAPRGAPAGRIAFPDESDDWVRAAKDYSSSRYSPLDEITAESVRTLTVAFTFSTGTLAGHEAAPIVANGTMYVV